MTGYDDPSPLYHRHRFPRRAVDQDGLVLEVLEQKPPKCQSRQAPDAGLPMGRHPGNDGPFLPSLARPTGRCTGGS